MGFDCDYFILWAFRDRIEWWEADNLIIEIIREQLKSWKRTDNAKTR